jgi:hypothetical protein
MNEISELTCVNSSATAVKPTATRAWPTTFAVLLSPSDLCRRILMRSSAAPTIPRPTATPSTARPAAVIRSNATLATT